MKIIFNDKPQQSEPKLGDFLYDSLGNLYRIVRFDGHYRLLNESTCGVSTGKWLSVTELVSRFTNDRHIPKEKVTLSIEG